jgi:hypothetical protein
MVPSVGIAPTSRPFQGHANLPQLQGRNGATSRSRTDKNLVLSEICLPIASLWRGLASRIRTDNAQLRRPLTVRRPRDGSLGRTRTADLAGRNRWAWVLRRGQIGATYGSRTRQQYLGKVPPHHAVDRILVARSGIEPHFDRLSSDCSGH